MSFVLTQNPTPFGFFDSDPEFQNEADNMVLFVKRKLGDDVLSVELTKKQIWACFEEAFTEYGAIVNQYQAKSQLDNLTEKEMSHNMGVGKVYGCGSNIFVIDI